MRAVLPIRAIPDVIWATFQEMVMCLPRDGQITWLPESGENTLVQPSCKKYFAFSEPQIRHMVGPVPPRQEGR